MPLVDRLYKTMTLAFIAQAVYVMNGFQLYDDGGQTKQNHYSEKIEMLFSQKLN